MPKTVNYLQTYWNGKGKYETLQKKLHALIPAQGEVKDAAQNPALEKFRVASNCYYDLYNNGLGNQGKEFHETFGFDAFEVGAPVRGDYRHEDGDYAGYIELTQKLVNRTEAKMDRIILYAALEQKLSID